MRTTVNFGCVARAVRPRAAGRAEGGGGGCFGALGEAAERFFEERVEWVPRRGVKLYFSESYSAVFEEYAAGRHWFFAVESGVAVACGVVAGVRPKTEAGCAALQWVNLGISVAAALTVLLWPFRSAHGNFNYALGNAGAVACAVLVVAGVDAVSDWIAVGFTLLTVASTLSSVVAAVLRLYRRWLRSLSAGNRGSIASRFSAFVRRWLRFGRARAQMFGRGSTFDCADPRAHFQSYSSKIVTKLLSKQRCGLLPASVALSALIKLVCNTRSGQKSVVDNE